MTSVSDRVWREFKRYAKLAGIPSTRNLHGMRHQTITKWIEDGFHTVEAALMADHPSQKVTELYTHLASKRLKEKMDHLGHCFGIVTTAGYNCK